MHLLPSHQATTQNLASKRSLQQMKPSVIPTKQADDPTVRDNDGCKGSQPPDQVPAGFHLSKLDRTREPSTDPVNMDFGVCSLQKPVPDRSKKLLICV